MRLKVTAGFKASLKGWGCVHTMRRFDVPSFRFELPVFIEDSHKNY